MKLVAALVAALHVTLAAPTHTPKIGVHWKYTVRATVAGKPVPGRITAHIVDPLGGAHLVEYGLTTKKIRNRPFNGVFRDFVIWPPESRGIPLTFRITVVAAHTRKVVRYTVVPRR